MSNQHHAVNACGDAKGFEVGYEAVDVESVLVEMLKVRMACAALIIKYAAEAGRKRLAHGAHIGMIVAGAAVDNHDGGACAHFIPGHIVIGERQNMVVPGGSHGGAL